MATLSEDIATSAEWIAAALTSSGYHADFSGPSLWEVERFFEEQTGQGRPVRGGLLSQDLGTRVFALGAYVGEVIRRSVGGEWATDDEGPSGEINAQLRLTDGGVLWPMQRVMGRVADGSEDGVVAYGVFVGVTVGDKPAAPQKRKGLFGGRGRRH